uniref:Interleukin 18 receptor accessory protein n=1 Tax=Dromaius novaehollandiae TaxID=8790 RepID=A0A8C4P547_DRONO
MWIIVCNKWLFSYFTASDSDILLSCFSGCSRVKPQIWYRAISNEEFVLQCALPDKEATHIFNKSLLKQHEAKWFWRQNDKEPLKAITEKSSNPLRKGNALWFKMIGVSASGIYICMIRYVAGEKIPCLKMILEVQTKSEANCSDYGTNTLYLLAGRGDSIVCPGTKCYSPIKKPDVKWYKVRFTVLSIQERSVQALVYDKDAGMYVCDYTLFDNNTEWTMRTIVTVEVIGKPLELKCIVQFGFERVSLQRVYCKYIFFLFSVLSSSLKGRILGHVAKLKEVTERDLRSNFMCFAQNAVGNATAVIKLKRKQRVFFLYVLCSAISTLFAFLVCVAFVYQHWIEIVLIYRSYLVQNETAEDGKEFDAFVSYAKLDSSESESALISEEKFALELLPDILENKYGYKLCLLERDILPGGAYTDEVVTAIRQSRRAIIILSPAYVSGPSIFELQAAVNCALEDKKIKLLLVKFQAFQEPETLPPVVKKALRILPVITWKSSISAAPNKKFWKYMRYHMPVKTTKMLGNYSLKGFFQSLILHWKGTLRNTAVNRTI